MNAKISRDDIVRYAPFREVPDEYPHESNAGRIPDHLRQRVTLDLIRAVMGENTAVEEDVQEQDKRMDGNGDEEASAILEEELDIRLNGLQEEHTFPP
jgi:hypothetical protein